MVEDATNVNVNININININNNWLSPFFLVSLTFNMIGLMDLVYLLYQVMGESFVKADIFSQRRSGAGDGKDEKERNSSEDLPKKTSSSAHKLERRKTK